METPRHGQRRGGLGRRLAALLGDRGLFGRSLAIIVLVSAWVATWRPQIDPDFGWHRAVGDAILATGQIPHTDTFSWLTGGGPFIAHSWAWDVLLTLADRAAGLTGTSLLATPVAAAAIALTWYLIGLTAPTIPPLPRALLVALAIVIGLPVWSPRAQIWDVVLVLACAAAWATWLRRGHLAALAVVPVIPILWVNFHGGSAPAFLACLLALLVAIPVGVRWGTWPRRPWRPLAISTVVALAAFVLNPYGPDILMTAFNGAVGNAFLPDIAEWQPPQFGDAGFIALRIALAATALVAFAVRGRRRDPLMLLLAAGWAFLALGAARFSIVAGPLLVVALAPAVAGSARAWLGLQASDRAPLPDGPRGVAIAASAVAILLSLVIAVVGFVQISPARQAAAVDARYPARAVEILLTRGCHGRLLNAYDWGGYLIATWTDPIGTYGSSPKDLVAFEAQLERVEVDPRAFLDDARVDVVLMPAGNPLSRWLDEANEWSVAYRDDQATIHLRAGSTACAGVIAAVQIL